MLNETFEKMLRNVFPEKTWEMADKGDIWREKDLAMYSVQWLKNQPEALKFLEHFIVKMDIPEDSILLPLLSQAFPEHKWAPTKSMDAYFKKSQYMLKEALHTIFPREGK